ncbi:MAG: hypothetical protein Q9182_001111 [Xanthomendoza sp. 2 TL-2023]
MSLSVHDPRSRGKSPGRRDRSRSRDTRAPSPHRPVRETTKKGISKYYDSSSASDTKRKKSTKKYIDESDSDDGRYRKSSRRHKEESDSDTYKKHSKARYSDNDSDDRSKKSSRRHREKRRDESESGSSSSESHHRSSRRKESKTKHKVAEPKHRRTSSPDNQVLTKRMEYVHSSKPQYDPDRIEGRHPSYAGPNPYEHAGPNAYTRPLNYSGAEASSAIPGQYNRDYDHPNEAYNQSRHSSISQEQQRQLSVAGGVNANIGYGQHPQYLPQQVPPQYNDAQYNNAHYNNAQTQQQRPEAHRIHSASSAGSGHFQYADPPQDFNYSSKSDGRKPSYSMSAKPQFVEAKPPNSALYAEQPTGLGSKMRQLSVSGGAAAGMLALTPSGQHHSNDTHGGPPPGSPRLDDYRGTYQSISPMPSPLMLPSTIDEGLSDLDPLSSGYSSNGSRHKTSHHGRKPSATIASKRVSFYDPEPDALALAAALIHSTPDPVPIIKILPQLSEDHILELRTEYKKHVKVHGKGINIAKHIRVKVTQNLGKAAYAVALGRWESEAYWANSWYQSNSSRRELLIESLMGRTNSEIVKIKDAFSDKRYKDSLEACMQGDLPKDKFRHAILLALEGKRQDNNEKLDINFVRRDVHDLYQALMAKEGGETAMINIIVVRSDRHLREVLRTFESFYKQNFAREMIQKSRNLVGETLAHILNGVLNRPVRDALLLHQAITETSSKDRADLLVSRLVRFHWEPKHLEKVKAEYRRKYGDRLEQHVRERIKGDFGEFCLGLCGGGVR